MPKKKEKKEFKLIEIDGKKIIDSICKCKHRHAAHADFISTTVCESTESVKIDGELYLKPAVHSCDGECTVEKCNCEQYQRGYFKLEDGTLAETGMVHPCVYCGQGAEGNRYNYSFCKKPECQEAEKEQLENIKKMLQLIDEMQECVKSIRKSRKWGERSHNIFYDDVITGECDCGWSDTYSENWESVLESIKESMTEILPYYEVKPIGDSEEASD